MDQVTDQAIKPEISDPQLNCGFSAEEIRGELARILSSRTFHTARGQCKFLAYAVTQFIAGRSDLIKECWIGREALGRGDSFDPRLDPIVRTQARKLRIRLAKYYETEGANAPIRIEFHKGSYAPVFLRAPGRSEATVPAQSATFAAPADVPEERAAPSPPPLTSPSAPIPQQSVERPSLVVRNPAVLAISLCVLIFAVAIVTYRWLIG
jgi:hypothetical protein